MRTFSLLRGLPVYDQTSGSIVGEVFDLSVTKAGLVNALLIKKGSLFKQTFFLSIDKVTSFGADGVMIDDPKQIVKLKTIPDYTFATNNAISGKMLLSKSGDSLGLLEDVYFQEEVGTIVGYEVTDGFFTDISEGKHVFKTNTPPRIGKDAIIVDVK
ncbi:MAG: PRC-barrel domain-containing protein [Bacillota bacterium]|nr:PRC-barrel domain-containing protein [Bacillota bacterium]